MNGDQIISKINKNSKSLLYSNSSNLVPDTTYRYINRSKAGHPTISGKLILNQRHPYVDEILDASHNLLRVVTELAGVEKQDIRLSIRCGVVQIFADGKNKKYIRIPLKYPVYYNSPKISLTNGILEIAFRLKQKHFPGLSINH